MKWTKLAISIAHLRFLSHSGCHFSRHLCSANPPSTRAHRFKPLSFPSPKTHTLRKVCIHLSLFGFFLNVHPKGSALIIFSFSISWGFFFFKFLPFSVIFPSCPHIMFPVYCTLQVTCEATIIHHTNRLFKHFQNSTSENVLKKIKNFKSL